MARPKKTIVKPKHTKINRGKKKGDIKPVVDEPKKPGRKKRASKYDGLSPEQVAEMKRADRRIYKRKQRAKMAAIMGNANIAAQIAKQMNIRSTRGRKAKETTPPQHSVQIMQNRMVDAMALTYGNVTKSLEITGIDRELHKLWLSTDPLYKERLSNIDEIKKDFVEAQLFAEIAKGNTTLIHFAAKTLLRDRGYIENPKDPIDKPSKDEPFCLILSDSNDNTMIETIPHTDLPAEQPE